jgi:effector-binding domain-containing protein
MIAFSFNRLVLLALASFGLFGCQIGERIPAPDQQSLGPEPTKAELRFWHSFQPDLPISSAPFENVEANWKQRIDQPYVFVEFIGSYTETGRLLPMVHNAMQAQGVEPAGPPFALYYDDPGNTRIERLRSRACVPVNDRVSVTGDLAFDLLPSTTVVYAFASGAYPDVPRAYPGMYRYMAESGWVENGPIRETYLVSPTVAQDFENLLTEIQIPVTYSR